MHLIFNRLLKTRVFKKMFNTGLFNPVSGHMLSKWIYNTKEGPAVFAFTSRLRNEGVSTVVAGLAREFGAMKLGQVLVLDVSPGRNGVSSLFETSVHPVKFDDLQTEDTCLSDFIVHIDAIGVDVLKFSESDQTYFREAQRERSILNKVLSSYKVVLLDTGALVNGGRTHWLNYCQYRIFVVDATKTTEEILERLRKEIESSGITFDGSILNKKIYYIPKIFYWLVH